MFLELLEGWCGAVRHSAKSPWRLGTKVYGSGFRVQGSELRLGVWGLGHLVDLKEVLRSGPDGEDHPASWLELLDQRRRNT